MRPRPLRSQPSLPAGRLNVSVVVRPWLVFFRRLLFLLLVVAVFSLFLPCLRSTRPILRLAASRRRGSRTRVPGDKLWLYKHALYFLPLFLWCVCSLEGQGVISIFFCPPPPASLNAPQRHLQFRGGATAGAVIAAEAKPRQGFLFIYLLIYLALYPETLLLLLSP